MIFNYLGTVFVDKKVSLANIEYKDENRDKIDFILAWWVVNYHERMKDWLVNTWLNISTEDILSLLWLSIEDFENKVSLDIWWGFSGLPFLLESIKTNTIIVDPIFNYMMKANIQKNIGTLKKIHEHIPESISKNKNRIDELYDIVDTLSLTDTNSKIKLSNLNNEISDLELKNEKFNQLIKSYNELIIILNKWFDLKDTDLSEMSSDKWLQIWKNIVNINCSYWDKIEWIEANSVDIIFINHVITKSTVDPIKLLKQADKLLKEYWKIYIMENDIIYLPQLTTFLDYDIEVKHERNKSIFILTKKI